MSFNLSENSYPSEVFKNMYFLKRQEQRSKFYRHFSNLTLKFIQIDIRGTDSYLD